MLRHGAMHGAFTGLRAPFTLGSFLRVLPGGSCGNCGPSPACSPAPAGPSNLLPSSDQAVCLDIDSRRKQVYGAADQGAEHSCTKVRGLHFQIVTGSTTLAAPVVAEALRKSSAGSAKGAAP
ncbi:MULTISPECIES: hypothetical protein [Streptomyces]|uniref:TnpC protein n=1 Tax=Streptomyces bottropensis ATCC 25435 TaxID=1054862 RepID=M3E5G4_9ACTN|nr:MULTISPECIES: hypothetical protein [Streptomyces]EMF51276.1 TnpC protein [Streptomyces bottropensis ATCC 25435]MZD20630.1 hypothetical protein [Streptomyces sp. SID5476]